MGLPSGTFTHPASGRLQVVFRGAWTADDAEWTGGDWDILLRCYVGTGAARRNAMISLRNPTAMIEVVAYTGGTSVPVGMEYVTHSLGSADTVAARPLNIACHLLPAAPWPRVVTTLGLLQQMLDELQPMSATEQSPLVPVGGTTRWVRPLGAHANTPDGLSYATAWLGKDAVVWAALDGGPSTLWICGTWYDADFSVQASGSAGGDWLDIRLDYAPDPARLYAGVVVDPTHWDEVGGSGEWRMRVVSGGPTALGQKFLLSSNFYLIEDGVRLIGCGTSGREAMRVQVVDLANNTLTIGNERPFVTGQVTIIPEFGQALEIPEPLIRGGYYWVIRVDDRTCKLATSYADAIAGTAIDLTTAGDGLSWFLYTLNPETHYDPEVGALQPGEYQWEPWAAIPAAGPSDYIRTLRYRPSSGTPADHQLIIDQERTSAVAAPIYAGSRSYVRILGGGTWGGIPGMGTECVGRIGYTQADGIAFEFCSHVEVHGVDVDIARTGVSFLGGSHFKVRDSRLRNCGWHAAGGIDTLVYFESHEIYERCWIHDIGQRHDWGDTQSVVINTNNEFGIVRRNLVQRIGRNVNRITAGVVSVDSCRDVHLYRNVFTDTYGPVFACPLGQYPHVVARNSISSNLVLRANREATPYNVNRGGLISVNNNSNSSGAVYDGLHIFGNLVGDSSFPDTVSFPDEVHGVVVLRQQGTACQTTNLVHERNAYIDIADGSVLTVYRSAVTRPEPDFSSRVNLYAGIWSTNFYRHRIGSMALTESVAVVDMVSAAATGAMVGQEAGTEFAVCQGAEINDDIPALALQLLSQDADYDSDDFAIVPALATIGAFPFGDVAEA